MYAKKLTSIKESLDIDYQLMACELDTSVKSMRYISKSEMIDSITSEAFDLFVRDIEKENGVEITSFNDNTVLYEYLDEAVVVYTNLNDKVILFDSIISQKMERKLISYI